MTLIDYLLRPDIASLSDEAALAAASVPILTPRADRITADSLAAILGGPAGAAVYNGIVALTQSTTPQIAGFARYALAVLGGKGFDPANAEAATIAGTLVAAFTKFFNVTSPTGTVNSLPDAVVATQTSVDNLDTEIDDETAKTDSLLARLGAFAGSGVNTVKGFFLALMGKTATKPSDVDNSFNPATDSNEAIRDEGDAAWVTGDGTGGGGGGGATGTYGKHYGG